MVDKGLARIRIRTSGPMEEQGVRDLTGEFFVHVSSLGVGADAFFYWLKT